ncbi:MAG: hypothetical protein DRN04_13935, partial [Thermoprotei archaeon]
HNTLPGGVQRLGISEAAWLNKAGCKTILISIIKSKEWDLISRTNTKILYLFKGNELLERFFGTLVIDKLSSKLKYLNLDFVIAHNIPSGQVALKLKSYLKGNRFKKTTILYLHDPLAYTIAGSLYYIYTKYFPSVLLKIEEKIIQNVDFVLANSKRTLTKINKIHGKKIDIRDKAAILYPTVNTPLPEHEIKREKKHYLLIVGRIDHEAFLNLYKIIRHIDIPLVIAGSYHPYNVKARKIIGLFYALRGRGKRIKIILYPSDKELLTLYRNALIFVYPGHENFNMSAIEAMSAGCPVLVADTSGVCEIMPKGLREYLCIPKNAIDLWVNRILEIVKNDESYHLGKDCWRITLKHNIYTHMSKLIKILRDLLQ